MTMTDEEIAERMDGKGQIEQGDYVWIIPEGEFDPDEIKLGIVGEIDADDYAQGIISVHRDWSPAIPHAQARLIRCNKRDCQAVRIVS